MNNSTNAENEERLDIIELERYLGSIQYTVPTKSILELQSRVEEWISMNDCGAIIYGESRAGKTRAIRYISSHLKEKYSFQLPIYIYTATDHVSTRKKLFMQLYLQLLGTKIRTRGQLFK